MAYYFQILSAILLSYLCTIMGMISSWPSSTILIFKSPNTTLDRPMTEMEISLFGSLPAFGCLIMNPIAGFLLDSMGRKRTALLAGILLVIPWSIIAITNRVELILFAMFIAGLGCIAFLVINVYVSEISQDSIRGIMTATPIQFYAFGFLVTYLVGQLAYNTMVYVCLTMAVIGVLIVGLMKESPITLMTKGLEKEAAESIGFYRRENSTSPEVVQEINKLRRLITISKSNSSETQSLTTFEEKPHSKLSGRDIQISRWDYFKKSKATQRELFIVMALKISFIYQGLPVIQIYAEPIFTLAVPNELMSANFCSVLLGIVVLISGFLAVYLTDVIGRRFVLIYASAASGILCLIIGAQLLTDFGPKWVVPVAIFIYTFFYVLGAGTMTFVILAEVFVPKMKSVLSMIVVQWAWVLNFTILFFYHPAVSSFGLPPIFFLFAAVCFATAVFCWRVLPETKGLSVSAMQEIFSK